MLMRSFLLGVLKLATMGFWQLTQSFKESQPGDFKSMGEELLSVTALSITVLFRSVIINFFTLWWIHLWVGVGIWWGVFRKAFNLCKGNQRHEHTEVHEHSSSRQE
jgi:hypothetical protein